MEAEEWRPVVGFESAYMVSSRGRVKSLTRTVHRIGRGPFPVLGRILKPWPSPHGYPLVNLSFNGRRRCYPVHVLVCEAWHGPRPPGMLARHLDDVPDHIWPENIAWGTPLDNAQDAIRNGRNVLLKRVECKRGHPYDDRNTYFDRRGHRRCRACAAQYFRERRARIKEERKERGS
ncbi:NUMOD4 domain-containing protein [Microbacterium paraoxydans]